MLSNKHRYTLYRLLKFLLSLPLTLLAPFFVKKPYIILTSALNKVFEDNSQALFEALYTDERFKDNVYFVLNDKEKRAQLNQIYPGKFISNTSWKNIKLILSAQYWCASSLELPAPGLFNRHWRTVYHLGHGMPLKKAGLAERKVSWYKKLYYKLHFSNISYTWCPVQSLRDEVAQTYGVKTKRIKVLPQPKTATIATPLPVDEPELNNENFTHVLYVPTWRPYADVLLFPFPDQDLLTLDKKLQELNMYIWIRCHPRFSEIKDNDLSKYTHIKEFSVNSYSCINYYLSYFDALITDYSSLYYEFLNLERPIFFFDYDFEKYNQIVGVIDQYNDLKAIPSITSQKKLITQLYKLEKSEIDVEPFAKLAKEWNYPIELKEINTLLLDELFSGIAQRENI